MNSIPLICLYTGYDIFSLHASGVFLEVLMEAIDECPDALKSTHLYALGKRWEGVTQKYHIN